MLGLHRAHVLQFKLPLETKVKCFAEFIMFNMLNKYFYIGFSEATIKYLYMHLFYAHMNQISKYSRYKHSEIFCIIIKYLLASIFMYSKIQIYCIVYLHPNIVQACIKYLLMSDSRNHMLDRFKKEFEGIWPR